MHYPCMLTPEEMHLREKACGKDAKPQVPEAPGDLQRASAGRQPVVQLAEPTVHASHDGADPAAPAVVVHPLGEGLGFAQTLQRPPDFAELDQQLSQLEADIEALLQRGLALGQRLEEIQRLLEEGDGLAAGRPRACKLTRLAPIADRLARKPGLGEMAGDNL